MKVDIVKKAASFAKERHKHQKRKTGEPYFIHPKNVARTVSNWTKDKNVIAAGYLHDVIEDTGADYEDIEERFGKKVADYVSLMSRDMRLPKNKSLSLFRRQLGSAPPEVKLIAAADMENNASSIADTDFMKSWFNKINTMMPYLKRGNMGRYKKGILSLLSRVEKAEDKFLSNLR
ncbi:MAG TPA: HD domain-containing protein [Candidatus Paceibacterota bacterium]